MLITRLFLLRLTSNFSMLCKMTSSTRWCIELSSDAFTFGVIQLWNFKKWPFQSEFRALNWNNPKILKIRRDNGQMTLDSCSWGHFTSKKSFWNYFKNSSFFKKILSDIILKSWIFENSNCQNSLIFWPIWLKF